MRHEFIEYYGEPGQKYDEATWDLLYQAWQTAYSRGRVDLDAGVSILTNEEKLALQAGANCVARSNMRQAQLIRRMIAEDRPLNQQQKISREIAGRLAMILLTKGLQKAQMIKELESLVESLSGRDLETWALEYSIKEKMAMVA